MPYIAHAAVELKYDESPKEKNVWHLIKQKDNIQYRWKYSSDQLYHVIAGVFEDPNDALKCAKSIYVTLFYNVLLCGIPISDAGCSSYEKRFPDGNELSVDGYNGNELFFFWNKHYTGGDIGPGVYEVENSLDEFDDYKFVHGTLSRIRESDLNFDEVDDYLFLYCREAQMLFNTVLLAEEADYGIKMTIYCGLLEHLSKNKDKDPDVLDEYDELIRHVENSSLSIDKKTSMINHLNMGKKESSKGKIRDLCMKYAKHSYGKYSCTKILNEAYAIRSAFSHGENDDVQYKPIAEYIKLVVLDVIKNYMIEKEKMTSENY